MDWLRAMDAIINISTCEIDIASESLCHRNDMLSIFSWKLERKNRKTGKLKDMERFLLKISNQSIVRDKGKLLSHFDSNFKIEIYADEEEKIVIEYNRTENLSPSQINETSLKVSILQLI
jgi:hypothetical protein